MKTHFSKMKGSFFGFFLASLSLLVVPTLFFGGAGGCGSSSSSSDSGSTSSGGSGTSSGTGSASTASLSAVPSVDISNIDYSTSPSSSSSLVLEDSDEASLTIKNATDSPKTGLGQNFNAVGNPSRAGCEANMHKKEIRRHGKENALDFCYVKAMEKASLITIPKDGTAALYAIVPPKDIGDKQGKSCDNIPKEHTEEIEACKKGGEGPGTDGMKVKIAQVGKELQIDMCEGKTPTLTNEATYAVDGSKYIVKTARIGNFNGHKEKSSFDATIDLGTTGKVTDNIPDLGDGTATATSIMDGGFGSGTITFGAAGSTKSVTVSGVFKGKFKEPRTGLETSFTGKAYSMGDSKTGCAKFSFTGAPPPMPLKDMIPFDIPEAQLDNFLQNFGLQLGIVITKDNYKTINLCPNANANIDPGASGSDVPPMVIAGTAGCDSQTHTGVECFSVTNGTKKANFGTETKQQFIIVANSASAYYKDVNAFDLSKLTASSSAIAFSRNWDCTGSFTTLDFSKFTEAQATAAQTAMQDCFKIEEEARGDNGMGDHNCDEQQQQGDMNNYAKNGPRVPGNFGGSCQKTATTCTPPGKDTYFFKTVDPDTNKYCLAGKGTCDPFTVTGTGTGVGGDPGKGASNLRITETLGTGDTAVVTGIHYAQSMTSPATTAHIDLTMNGRACTVDCAMSAPKSFDKPPDFDPNAAKQDPSGAGNKQPGQAGFVPKACTDAGLTTETACRGHCEQFHDCR